MCNYDDDGLGYQQANAAAPAFVDPPSPPTIEPERKLAALMLAETGVKMDAKMLRLFILANWTLVAKYAHLIHGGPPK